MAAEDHFISEELLTSQRAALNGPHIRWEQICSVHLRAFDSKLCNCQNVAPILPCVFSSFQTLLYSGLNLHRVEHPQLSLKSLGVEGPGTLQHRVSCAVHLSNKNHTMK